MLDISRGEGGRCPRPKGRRVRGRGVHRQCPVKPLDALPSASLFIRSASHGRFQEDDGGEPARPRAQGAWRRTLQEDEGRAASTALEGAAEKAAPPAPKAGERAAAAAGKAANAVKKAGQAARAEVTVRREGRKGGGGRGRRGRPGGRQGGGEDRARPSGPARSRRPPRRPPAPRRGQPPGSRPPARRRRGGARRGDRRRHPTPVRIPRGTSSRACAARKPCASRRAR